MKITRFTLMLIAFVFATIPLHGYTVKGKVVSTLGCAAEGARVEVLDVNQLPGSVLTTRSLGAAVTDANGNFSVTFPWTTVTGPPMPPNYESGNPDLIFRATQRVDGTSVSVLNEATSKTRWNLASGSSVTLTALATAVCHGQVSSAPANADFVFTRIGRIPLINIDCAGNVPTTGLAFKSATTATNGDYTNQPFGGTMDVFGFFGSMSGVNRYKFEYSADNGATWTELTDPLWDYYYESSTHVWISEPMGPVSHAGVNNLYKLPYVEKPANAWSWFNRLAVVDTRRLPDGPVLFRVEGYYWDGTTLTPGPASLQIDPVYGKIRLEIDNTAPTYAINGLYRNGVPVAACAFISMNATDTLDVQFNAHDNRGHLGGYVLRAMFGHNQVVVPDPTMPNKAVDGYSNHVSGTFAWSGQTNYTTRFTGYSTTAMPTCAYQIRLDVSKRTTNGYDLIYSGLEDTWHIAIQR